MFKLTPAELLNARTAIDRHGYSTLIPTPPEWRDVHGSWDTISSQLCDLDLDEYTPHTPLRVFAPKTAVNLRPIDILHPEDLLIYTALTLIVKNDIEDSRLSPRSHRVFSYRVDDNQDSLYGSTIGSHESYMRTLKRKAQKKRVTHVAVADIADFFPRIYQHRLHNIVRTVASSNRGKDTSRVLEKLISNLMDRNSYGIPLGPYASRVLGEAVLIDVDDHLIAHKIDFVRWVDDYNIFATSGASARLAIMELGRRLFESHGLTLQAAKTRIFSVEDYRQTVLSNPEDDLSTEEEVIELLGGINDYGDEIDEDLVAELVEHLQSDDLISMLHGAIAESNVDYRLIGFVLRKLTLLKGAPEDIRRSVLELVLDNLTILGSVAEQLAKFILSLEFLTRSDKRDIGASLIKAIRFANVDVHEYLAMWILDIFAKDSDWNRRSELVKLYRDAHSEAVKRAAALGVANSGTRSEALSIVSGFASATPIHRLAILKASTLLGRDERRHWRNRQSFRGPLEFNI